MRVVKPTWINHVDESNKGKEQTLSIFSIDIHPDGSKVATGGQGNDCGRVSIWNMAPIKNPELENNMNVAKNFCHIDSHLQCVNAVRWSNSGNFLASAGDDQLIMVWSLSGRHSGPGPIEQYRTVSTLRNHSGDVLDLSWSNEDQWLASCSIDNMIVIWNAQRWPEIITILKGHSGMVKGVTFDPIGKYLASQSADKSLRVWRVSDWTEETVISEPFNQCGETTHFLRLSWSPDGQFLVSAQAMNNCGSVAKIIERQDWAADKDFVGHRKAIPVVKFNPKIFKHQSAKSKNNKDKDKENKGAKLKRQSVLAVGSRDRSISIWATARGSRPLMVCKDLFENTIHDFSWSRTGYQLMACSGDGTVAFIEFSESELGPIYSDDERRQYLQQLYGKSVGNSKSALMSNLIEDLDIMLLQKRTKEEELVKNSSANNSSTANSNNRHLSGTNGAPEDLHRPLKPTPAEMASNSNSSKGGTGGLRLAKGPLDKQIEIRSADGRRRIIPLFIPPLSDVANGDDQGNPGSSSAGAGGNGKSLNSMSFSSSSEAKSKIVIETRDESNPPLEYMTYVSSDAIMPNGITKNKSEVPKAKEPEFANKKTSVNGIADGHKQLNNVNISNNNTNESNDSNYRRTKSPVPSTSSAPMTNGTLVNGDKAKTTLPSAPGSSDSSSGDIIIRRKSGVKRKSSADIGQPQQQQSLEQMQQQQISAIPTKRKPGRPPGTGPNQQASKYQQQNSVEQVPSSSKLTELPNGSKSLIIPRETDVMRTAVVSNTPTNKSSTNNTTVSSNHHRSSISNPSSSSFSSRNFFPPLKLAFQQSSKLSSKLFTCSETGKVYLAELERPLSSSSVCKLTITVDNEPLWSVLLSSTICALSANQHLVVVACDDRSLHAFNTATGSRTFVPLIVESPVARMVIANRSHILLITCNAKLWLWDLLPPPKVILKGESLLPLLIHPKTNEQLSILNASVTPTGRAVVAVVNGRTYMYEADLSSWLLVADVNSPLNACTDLKPTRLNAGRGVASTVSKIPSRSLQNYFSSNTPTAQHGLISFIEQQLETAKVMANGKDYRYWLGTLVQNLVSLHSAGFTPENIELRLRELCNFLIGGQFPRSGGFTAAGVSMVAASSSSTPLASRSRASMMMAGAPFPSTGSSPQSSSNKVLGISKHELLREVLAMLASNLSLQRLYLEYKDQLESFSMSASMSASTMSMLHNHSTATNTTSTYLSTPKVAKTMTVESSNTAEEAMEKVD